MAIAKTAKREKVNCQDCKKEIEIEGKESKNVRSSPPFATTRVIKDGVLLKYDNGGQELMVLKCQDCFKKNPSLTNFQQCEVYSRIVGYLRPVQQWNTGKQKEFQERKEYKLAKDCC